MPTAAPQMPVFGSSPLGRCCPGLSLPFWDFFHPHLPREPLLPMPWAQPAAAIQRAFFAHCPSTGLSCGLCLPISNLSFPLLGRKTERGKTKPHSRAAAAFCCKSFCPTPKSANFCPSNASTSRARGRICFAISVWDLDNDVCIRACRLQVTPKFGKKLLCVLAPVPQGCEHPLVYQHCQQGWTGASIKLMEKLQSGLIIGVIDAFNVSLHRNKGRQPVGR